MIDLVRGHRSCDGAPGDADAVAACQARLDQHGWGTTGEELEIIPNRNVFVFDNVIDNPSGFQSASQQLQIHSCMAVDTGATNVPSPSCADTNLIVKGNVIWNGPHSLPLGAGGGSGRRSSNPTCKRPRRTPSPPTSRVTPAPAPATPAPSDGTRPERNACRRLGVLAYTRSVTSDARTAYLDYAATTPMRPEAIEAMLPFLTDTFGNPSGGHSAARAAKTALETAREQVAAVFAAAPAEIVFTAGGTEADNLAVKGAAHAARSAGVGDGVVTTRIEHKGVLASVDRLERDGFRVTRAGVDSGGIVDLDALADALDERTVVVSVMLVNNEVGTIQPLAEVVRLVRERAPHAVVHTDAVQAVAWLDLAAARDADLIAISAHKFGGPKGVGALVVRPGVSVTPLVEGGGQERELRPGTSNVAGVVAMAAALRATVEQRDTDVARIRVLRDRLASGLADRVSGTFFNGDPTRKVAGNCHVGFPGVEAEALLVMLDGAGVCAAAGSSCSSGATDPSHVLAAMGIERADALASIRVSLGVASTDADIDLALDVIPECVEKLRAAGTVPS